MKNPAPAAPRERTIRLTTGFGEFDVDPRDILSFPDGLPGFESCRRFVVLSSETTSPLQLLQAVGGEAASFLAIDPRLVVADYACPLTAADLLRLGADGSEPLVWLALIALGEGGGATVNLRAPVVVNPARMTGFQVVPSISQYPLRHPLVVA